MVVPGLGCAGFGGPGKRLRDFKRANVTAALAAVVAFVLNLKCDVSIFWHIKRQLKFREYPSTSGLSLNYFIFTSIEQYNSVKRCLSRHNCVTIAGLNSTQGGCGLMSLLLLGHYDWPKAVPRYRIYGVVRFEFSESA